MTDNVCIEVFGLLWDSPAIGVWNARGTYIPMTVRILSSGFFTYSLGFEEVGEFPTMPQACLAATSEAIKRLKSQLKDLENFLNTAK